MFSKNKMDIAGAVLAGGRNKRMGGVNKAFINIDGLPIVQRTLNILQGIFDEIILVTNSPLDYTAYGKKCVIVTDIIKDAGPLGGIHAALNYTSKKNVFFVACDMPFLHNGIIIRQLRRMSETDSDAVVPRAGPLIEPLHAVYKKDLKDRISYFLKNSRDYSIRHFLETITVYYWDLEDTGVHRDIFKNLNMPEEVTEARRHYGSKVKSLA